MAPFDSLGEPPLSDSPVIPLNPQPPTQQNVINLNFLKQATLQLNLLKLNVLTLNLLMLNVLELNLQKLNLLKLSKKPSLFGKSLDRLLLDFGAQLGGPSGGRPV